MSDKHKEPRFGRQRVDAWSEEQTECLEHYWGVMPDGELAQTLGRTLIAVQTRAWLLGFSKVENRRKHWEEIKERVA